MELSKFCPKCGEETERLYGNKKKLCADCYGETYDLIELPSTVEITVCPVCGRMRKRGEWIEEYTLQDQLAAKFSEFSEEDIEMELQYWEEDERMFVRVHSFKGEIESSQDTELKIHNQECDNCSRFEGGFYKVKMQLRGNADLERVSEELAERAAEVTNEDRNDFLSNINKNSDGVDFFLSTEKIAGELLNSLKSRHDPEVKRSYELVGQEDGQKVYRNVISVRL
ncbi:MAG: NMD3-related protein [Candidatus Nanohaloarchaea archaeon]